SLRHRPAPCALQPAGLVRGRASLDPQALWTVQSTSPLSAATTATASPAAASSASTSPAFERTLVLERQRLQPADRVRGDHRPALERDAAVACVRSLRRIRNRGEALVLPRLRRLDADPARDGLPDRLAGYPAQHVRSP